MSLKNFHLAFITISVLTALGFAVWAFLTNGLPGSVRIVGGFSFLGGIALLVYGVKFYQKAKNMVS